MKKIYSLFFACVFAFSANAGTTTTKTDGGPTGYRTVTESHVNDTHLLTCSDPGNLSCDWANTAGNLVISYANIEGEVESNINSHVLSGHYATVDDNNATVEVSWDATDLYNLVITID
jgi:hypothetical protein